MVKEITLSEEQWKQVREWMKSFFKRTKAQKEKRMKMRMDRLLR